MGFNHNERERRRKDSERDQQAAEFRGLKKLIDRYSPFKS